MKLRMDLIKCLKRSARNMNHDIETQSYREQKERERQRQLENQNQNRKQEISIGQFMIWWIVMFVILALIFEY